MTQPEVLNLICPQCAKTWLNKGDGHYFCYACNFVQVDRAVKEYAAKLVEAATSGMSIDTDHKAIYLLRHDRNVG